MCSVDYACSGSVQDTITDADAPGSPGHTRRLQQTISTTGANSDVPGAFTGGPTFAKQNQVYESVTSKGEGEGGMRRWGEQGLKQRSYRIEEDGGKKGDRGWGVNVMSRSLRRGQT